MDYDNVVEYFIENVPYLWIFDKDYRECRRFYFLNVNTCVFDKIGRVDRAAIWPFNHAREPVDEFHNGMIFDYNKDTLSILYDTECFSAKYFSVFPFMKDGRYGTWEVKDERILITVKFEEQREFPFTIGKKWEIRMNGRPFSGDVLGYQQDPVKCIVPLITRDGTKLLSVPPQELTALSAPPLIFDHNDNLTITDTTNGRVYSDFDDLAKAMKDASAEKLYKDATTKGERFQYGYLNLPKGEKRCRLEQFVEWYHLFWTGKFHYNGPSDSNFYFDEETTR